LKFSEIVRLIEANGFYLVKEKGSIRYYGKSGWPVLIRVDYHGSKEAPSGTCRQILKAAGIIKEEAMIDLPYSLIVEATEEPDFFGFYSPELEGFTGVGHSIEDCVYKAKWGMKEHVELLQRSGLPVPAKVAKPKIIIQNEEKMAA
jgi:predicted RNA binding protein YcfA (HicA-like mRNA interferase family)/predicted RNase H-like HicB family nuclease